MTKKHYEAIAKIINAYDQAKLQAETRLLLHSIEQDLATYFKAENPRFDPQRFLIACNKNHS